jgi:predicted amidohydrolase YtcJ
LEAIGFQLHFHATGDRGAGLALDAIAAAGEQNRRPDRRHRITHLYLVAAADRRRFEDLGVVADFQLAPSSTRRSYTDLMTALIGSRANRLLPAADLLATGAEVVLSSDWDAEALSPLAKLAWVIQRDLLPGADLAQVLRMMTIDVARLLHHEQETGSLEVGKLADLIVLDQNLFEIAPRQIAETEVLVTLVGGVAVHDPAGLIAPANRD